ncbi:ion transporter [Fusibacter sp. 3D3]|uniref:ion transporter n=1 Tax=Fusibacter sp. 3D3 TaxID=1048380 RepID=UPI000852E658|nr:ion transporter [Fusibacter sp. 3D3]GAU79922.1 potassium voltage-gated channel subfamily KQT [Fusibacter sp. 3D3]
MEKYSSVKSRTYEIIEKAQKGDKASKYFDSIILLLIISNTISIVLESFNSIYSLYYYQFRTFEIISVVIFTIEYALRIWTADLRYPSSKTKVGAIFKYMFSTMAMIDLFAILPFYLPMLIKVDLRFLRMFRISRLLRILKINRYTRALGLITGVVKEKKDELLATVFVMGFMIMISSTMMYYFESEVQPDSFPNIVASFWWSIATLTTVGYGDIYPITAMGKLFASIIAILGIGLVALPTGIISSGFIELITKKDIEKTTIICPHCGESIEHDL